MQVIWLSFNVYTVHCLYNVSTTCLVQLRPTIKFFEDLQDSGFLQNQNKLKIFGFWTKIGLKMSMHLVIKSKNTISKIEIIEEISRKINQ